MSAETNTWYPKPQPEQGDDSLAVPGNVPPEAKIVFDDQPPEVVRNPAAGIEHPGPTPLVSEEDVDRSSARVEYGLGGSTDVQAAKANAAAEAAELLGQLSREAAQRVVESNNPSLSAKTNEPLHSRIVRMGPADRMIANNYKR